MSMLTRIDCVVMCYLSVTNPNHKKKKKKVQKTESQETVFIYQQTNTSDKNETKSSPSFHFNLDCSVIHSLNCRWEKALIDFHIVGCGVSTFQI